MLSFTGDAGSTTAIVGESGSCKSTRLALLFRCYDVDSGSIFIDDSHICDLAVGSLRSHIVVVPQDTTLFNALIRYNILYAKPEATLNGIQEVCQAANIHERILSFPDAYETVVGDGGARLSGRGRSNPYVLEANFRCKDIPTIYEKRLP